MSRKQVFWIYEQSSPPECADYFREVELAEQRLDLGVTPRVKEFHTAELRVLLPEIIKRKQTTSSSASSRIKTQDSYKMLISYQEGVISCQNLACLNKAVRG